MPPIDIFQIYNDSSIPSAGDYLMDADRSTLRPFGPELKAEGLSTGYPMETYL